MLVCLLRFHVLFNVLGPSSHGVTGIQDLSVNCKSKPFAFLLIRQPIYLNDHIRAVDDFIQLVPDSLAHASTKYVFSLCVLEERNIHLFHSTLSKYSSPWIWKLNQNVDFINENIFWFIGIGKLNKSGRWILGTKILIKVVAEVGTYYRDIRVSELKQNKIRVFP